MSAQMRARQAAAEALRFYGHTRATQCPSISEQLYAAGAYVESLIESGDTGALLETVSEHNDAVIFQMFAKVAESLKWGNADEMMTLADCIHDIVGSYLADEVMAAKEMIEEKAA